jgi:nucleoside-diphosphate-sugar epimerase
LTVGVTGARGYVGSVVAQALAGAGHNVVALVRGRPQRGAEAVSGVLQRPYDLALPFAAEVLDGLDAVVHCAWDMGLTSFGDVWRVNVEGTNGLVAAAKEAGVRRLVFVSSMSAYDGTSQSYGLTKLACERVVLAAGGAVVRLGLVYGPGAGGMFGSLRKMGRLPVVPVIAGRARLFTVHEDDVAAALVSFVSADDVPSVPIGLAHPEPVTFEHILRASVAGPRATARFVPVPWPAVYFALRVGETLGVPLPFRSDSLLGLVRTAPAVGDQGVLRSLGLSPRSFV